MVKERKKTDKQLKFSVKHEHGLKLINRSKPIYTAKSNERFDT